MAGCFALFVSSARRAGGSQVTSRPRMSTGARRPREKTASDAQEGDRRDLVASWTPPSTLWVPGTLRTSCDVLILVNQSAKLVAPSDVMKLRDGAVGKGSKGSGLAEGTMWRCAL